MLVPLGGGLAAGLWLDGKLHSAPVFLLAGSLAGIVLATVLLVRKASRIMDSGGD